MDLTENENLVAADLKAEVRRRVWKLRARLWRLTRILYEHPEPGYQEFFAVETLTRMLEREGISVTRGTGGLPTAFWAEIPGGVDEPGPTVAILAEYDALPDVGHGCGHNFIAAAALGTVLALAPVMPRLPGKVVLLGTPAEEGVVADAGGKAALVAAGVFDGIDAALLVHPGAQNLVGVRFSAREALEVRFAVHPDRRPRPGLDQNPVEGLCRAFGAWERLRAGLRSDVRIHGVITDGGRSPQIPPRSATAQIYIRAADSDYLEEACRRVMTATEQVAAECGLRLEVRPTAHPYREMRSNRIFAEAFRRNWENLGTAMVLVDTQTPGSTDMGNVSQVVPAIHPYVNLGDPYAPAHTLRFARATLKASGRTALLRAASAMAMTTIDLLSSPKLMGEIWEEFLRA